MDKCFKILVYKGSEILESIENSKISEITLNQAQLSNLLSYLERTSTYIDPKIQTIHVGPLPIDPRLIEKLVIYASNANIKLFHSLYCMKKCSIEKLSLPQSLESEMFPEHLEIRFRGDWKYKIFDFSTSKPTEQQEGEIGELCFYINDKWYHTFEKCSQCGENLTYYGQIGTSLKAKLLLTSLSFIQEALLVNHNSSQILFLKMLDNNQVATPQVQRDRLIEIKRLFSKNGLTTHKLVYVNSFPLIDERENLIDLKMLLHHFDHNELKIENFS